jgi:hypothetical protein
MGHHLVEMANMCHVYPCLAILMGKSSEHHGRNNTINGSLKGKKHGKTHRKTHRKMMIEQRRIR